MSYKSQYQGCIYKFCIEKSLKTFPKDIFMIHTDKKKWFNSLPHTCVNWQFFFHAQTNIQRKHTNSLLPGELDSKKQNSCPYL